jgi:hypothetical protein
VVGPGIDDREHVIWHIADQYVTHLNLHPELILEVGAYAVVADR